MRRVIVGAVLLGVIALPAASSQAADPKPSAPCQVIAFSPEFASDGTAFCAYQPAGRVQVATNPVSIRQPLGAVQVFLTTDRGKSWRKAAGAGLPGPSDTHISPTLKQAVFSPLYSLDRALYLYVGSDGFFRSIDAGATWQRSLLPIDGDPGSSPVPLAPLVITTPALTENQPVKRVGAFAYAYGFACQDRGAASANTPLDQIVSWPGTTPVSGSQGNGCIADRQFVVPPTWPADPALVMGHGFGSSNSGYAEVSRCDVTLTCRERTFHIKGSPQRMKLSRDFGNDHTVWLSLYHRESQSFLTYISRDAGVTWKRWVTSGTGYSSIPLGALAQPQGAPRRMAVRFSADRSETDVRENSPEPWHRTTGGGGEFIYTSTDGGAHWKLTGYAPGANTKPKHPTTIGWNAPFGRSGDSSGLWWEGGRLFTLAERDVYDTRTKTWSIHNAGVWCSVDGGAHWAPNCSR